MDNNVSDTKIIINMWDSLYKRLKTIDENSLILEKQTNSVRVKQAILGYIASFGLSMIKDLYLNNTNSVGFLLSLRCIIEGLAVYLYIEKNKVTPEQEVVFKLQSNFIEKNIYSRYTVFDGVLFDLKIIIKNFEDAKQKLAREYNYTSNQIKNITKSRIPFIGNVRSFEKLIAENLPENFLIIYKTISLYVHPYDYRINNSETFTQYSIFTFRLLDSVFKNIIPSNQGLEFEYDRLIRYNEFGETTRNITIIQIKKINTLCKMLDELGFNFLSYSIYTCGMILYDYFADTAFGYNEQSTTKWKTAVESLWLLNVCIEDESFSKRNNIMYAHTNIKNKLNLFQEIFDNDFNIAYNFYLEKFPDGCNFEKFKKSFVKTTGYTINENGDTASLRESVRKLIDEFSPLINEGKIKSIIKDNPFKYSRDDESKVIEEVDLAAFLKMKYDESQAMSHGSGYLYYSLSGAWHDGTLLAVLYEELLQLLFEKLLSYLNNLYMKNTLSKTIVNFLRNFLNKNKEYINEKKKIYLMPKVKKDF